MNFKLKILYNLMEIKILKFLFKNNIKKIQKIRWNLLLKKISDSPFYKSYITSSFENFPVLEKKDFLKNFDLINTKSIKYVNAVKVALKAENTRNFKPSINDITVGLSTGTSGNKSVFLASENERAYWTAAVIDRVLGWSFKKRKIAFFLRANSNLYESVNSKWINFNFFDLLISNEKNLERLQSLDPTILVAQTSMLLVIADAVQNKGLKINPDKIISVAEVLSNEDKGYLEKIFCKKIHQVYQCNEGFLAHTCEKGNLHFNEDFLIIEKEYLDTEKKRFYPIITDLERITQPVIRYKLDDIIHEKFDCDCSLNSTAIEMIEGRKDDALKFLNSKGKEVVVFPDFIRRAIVFSDDNIINYSLTQIKENTVNLFVDGKLEYFEKAKKSIVELLEKFKISDIQIHKVDTLDHIKGTKLRRIKNEFK
jgi:putative adenylate-forming enzyme